MWESADFAYAHVATAMYKFASLRCWQSRDVRGGFHIVEADVAQLLDWSLREARRYVATIVVGADESDRAQPEPRIERYLSAILES